MPTKEKAAETEVAIKAPSEVMVGTGVGIVDFMEGGLEATDVERENIILLQSNSSLLKQVDGGKAGDLVRTDTYEVIGNSKDNPAKVIIIRAYKNWRKKGEGKKSFGVVKFTPGEELYDVRGETENGEEYYHQLQFNYLVLLADDPFSLPFVLTLRTKGKPAAKRINNIVSGLQRIGHCPWDQVINLYSFEDKNDDGEFYVVKAEAGEETKTDTRIIAQSWKSQLAGTIASKADAVDPTGDAAIDDDDIPF